MKKGFSLIEVVACISIIVMLSAGSLISIINYKRLSNETELLFSQTAVIALINNGKQYCREKEEPGSIAFDTENHKVSFLCEGRIIDTYSFPKGISIYSINTSQGKIDINRFGATADAGTIQIRDRKGILYDITINVGVGYAEIK